MIWDHRKTTRWDFIHSNTTETKLATLQIPMSPSLCINVKICHSGRNIPTSGYIQINLKMALSEITVHLLWNLPNRMVQTGKYPWKIQTSKQSIFGENVKCYSCLQEAFEFWWSSFTKNTKPYHNQPGET